MSKLKYVGYIFIIWGIVDIALSYMGTDVWSEWLGIQLEDFLYQLRALVAIVIGGMLIRFGGKFSVETE